VIAAHAGVPFIALPYDPKVSALCEDLRYPIGPLFVPGQPLPPPAELARRLDDAWGRRDELAAHLQRVQPEIAALAERNFDIVSDVVSGDVPKAAGVEG